MHSVDRLTDSVTTTNRAQPINSRSVSCPSVASGDVCERSMWACPLSRSEWKCLVALPPVMFHSQMLISLYFDVKLMPCQIPFDSVSGSLRGHQVSLCTLRYGNNNNNVSEVLHWTHYILYYYTQFIWHYALHKYPDDGWCSPVWCLEWNPEYVDVAYTVADAGNISMYALTPEFIYIYLFKIQCQQIVCKK